MFYNVCHNILSFSGVNAPWLGITLNFVGKFAITASYCAILVYAPELYPTNVRYSNPCHKILKGNHGASFICSKCLIIYLLVKQYRPEPISIRVMQICLCL